MTEVEVEIRRSRRRRSTAQARVEAGRIVVAVPAGLSAQVEAEWVSAVVHRLCTRLDHGGDDALLVRATRLSERYLGGHATPSSVRWVEPMRTRWASCTPADRAIRVSRSLSSVPDYVLDYVLLHELAHLLVSGHGRDFWTLIAGYPRLERARGFLDGHAAAGGLRVTGEVSPDAGSL